MRRGCDDLIRERLELIVLRDEIGLGVQLDQRAAVSGNQALGGRTLSALADVLGALDAKHLDRLIEVTLGFGESVLRRACRRPSAPEDA